jgi:hypothetical protein
MKYPLFLLVLVKLKFSRKIFETIQISNVMKIRCVITARVWSLLSYSFAYRSLFYCTNLAVTPKDTLYWGLSPN